MIRCPVCGYDNRDDSRQCQHCGSPLETPTLAASPKAPPPLPPPGGYASSPPPPPYLGAGGNPPGGFPQGEQTSFGSTGDPTTWLVISILMTLCCCLPFGIVGIVFSSQAITARNMGDFATAEEKIETTKKMLLIGLALGVLFNCGILLLQILVGGLSQM